jgi:hypothetical protein
MKKVLAKMGLEHWEYEVHRLWKEGMSEHDAKTKVVTDRMLAGDFRPLLSIIKENGVLRGPPLHLLAEMLADKRLTLKKGRGHPVDPEADFRDGLVADAYDYWRSRGVGHDDLVRNIGEVAGISPDAVRGAVTKRRKPKAP